MEIVFTDRMSRSLFNVEEISRVTSVKILEVTITNKCYSDHARLMCVDASCAESTALSQSWHARGIEICLYQAAVILRLLNAASA